MHKKIILVLYSVYIALFSLNAQTLRIATYNLRYKNATDTFDLWENRYPHIAGLVKLYDFDIFGTQEGLKSQLTDLKLLLSEYNYIGVGREDGFSKGEHSAIFYKKEKFELKDSGNFWLSEITDKPGKGWDAACVRICSWGKFMEKATGFTFFLFNVHFDHEGNIARKESVKLMKDMLLKIAGNAPVILTGDFNFNEKTDLYGMLNNSGIIRDVYDIADYCYAPNTTFNGFHLNENLKQGRIDHIFVSNIFKSQLYAILTNTYNGRFPSDHFPVFTILTY